MSIYFKRSIRRHHRERLKKKRRYYWNRDLYNESSKVLGQVVNTPHPCSCPGCGNARKYLGPTRQERRLKDEINTELNRIYYAS